MDPNIDQSSIRRSNRKRKIKAFDDYEVDANVYLTSKQDISSYEINQAIVPDLDAHKEQTSETVKSISRKKTSYGKRHVYNVCGRKKRLTENVGKPHPEPEKKNTKNKLKHPVDDKIDLVEETNSAGESDGAVTFLYRCVTKGCSKQFPTTGRLQDHKKQYHGESLRFICACCQKSFATLYTGRSHLRMDHSDTLAVEFTIQNTQVLVVEESVVVEAQLLICTKCGFSFSGEEVPEHDCVSKELQYYCPCCDFHSKVDKDMQQHLILTDNHDGEITAIKHMDKYIGLRSTAKEPGLNVDVDLTVCDLCGAEFDSNTELKSHLNMKHAYLPFACGVCKTCYGRKAALRNHMLTHTRPTLKCSICDKKFYEQSRLDVHEATHSGNRQHQCDICGNRYCDERSVKKHIMQKHQGITESNSSNKERKAPGVCHLCGKTYQSAAALNKHLKLHKNMKQFNCPFCEMSFREFNQYRDHKLTHQALDFSDLGGIKRVSYQTMQEIFQALKIYEEGHASGLPHKCNLCNKRFHTEKRLHGHIRVMHMRSEDKSFKCRICKKGFTTSAALRTHERLHENTKPYRCRICQKQFRQLGHIKDHLLHHGKANVQCALCKKMLKSRGTLRRHVVIHCKILPFKCPVKNCKQSFHSLPLILDHFKKCSLSVPTDTTLKCNLCEQSFTKAVMASHFHVHETDLNFTCTCGMSFANYHKLYFHKEKMKHFETSEFELLGNNNPLDRLEPVIEGLDKDELLKQFDYIEAGDEAESASDAISANIEGANMYTNKVSNITTTDEGELLCIAEQLTNMASGVIIQTSDPDMDGDVMEISIEEVAMDIQTEDGQVNEVILSQNDFNNEHNEHESLKIINLESGEKVLIANNELLESKNKDNMTNTQKTVSEDTTDENMKHENDEMSNLESTATQILPRDTQIQENGEYKTDIETKVKKVKIESAENKELIESLKEKVSPELNLSTAIHVENSNGRMPHKNQQTVDSNEKQGLVIYKNASKVDCYSEMMVTQLSQNDEQHGVLPEHSYSTETVKVEQVIGSDEQERRGGLEEINDAEDIINLNESVKKSAKPIDQQSTGLDMSDKRKQVQKKISEAKHRGRILRYDKTNDEIKVKTENDFCNNSEAPDLDKGPINDDRYINSIDLDFDLDEELGIETDKRKSKRKPKVKHSSDQSIKREYMTNKSSSNLKRLFMQRRVIYKCTSNECTKRLLTIDKMHKHKKLAHKENMKHICTVCDKQFGTFYVFKSHIRMEHSDLDFVPYAVKNVDIVINEQPNTVGKVVQVCTKCGYRCGELEDKTHSCTRMQLLYYCPCLEFSSVSPKDMEKHITENHPGTFRDISNEDRYSRLRSVKRGPAYKMHEQVISCESCKLSFNTQDEYKEHLNSKHANHPFVCGLCHFCYGRKSAMIKHMLNHKEEFKCSKCNKGFYEKTRLDAHMLTHNGHRPSQCELCGNRYCEEKNLKKHVMLKHPEYFKTCWPDSKLSVSNVKKVSSAVCHVCGMLCATETKLKIHMKKQHSEAYKCPDCGEAFNEIIKFKKHKLSHQTIDLSNTGDRATIKEVKIYEEDHPSGLPFKCGLCEKRFAKIERVQRHLRVIHLKSEDKKFVCQICNCGFVLKAALRTHMRLHNNSKPYRCRLCQKHFRQLGHIKDHLLHHGKPHLQCALCIKKFKSKGNLNRHIQVHCKIFPFKCPKPNCSAAFPNLFSFLSHSSNCVEPLKPETDLICCFCNKSFKAQNIISHYHTHEKDAKYPCVVCNMSFESYKGLYFHKEKQKHFEESEYDNHCNTKIAADKNDGTSDEQTEPGEDMTREELLRQYDYLGEDGNDLPDKYVELETVHNEEPADEDKTDGVVEGAVMDDTQDVVEIKLNEDVQALIGGDAVNAQVIINDLGEITGNSQVYTVTKPDSEDVTYYILQLDQTDS